MQSPNIGELIFRLIHCVQTENTLIMTLYMLTKSTDESPFVTGKITFVIDVPNLFNCCKLVSDVPARCMLVPIHILCSDEVESFKSIVCGGIHRIIILY